MDMLWPCVRIWRSGQHNKNRTKNKSSMHECCQLFGSACVWQFLSPKPKKAMELALPVSKGCCALRVNFKVFGQDWLGSRLLSLVLFLSWALVVCLSCLSCLTFLSLPVNQLPCPCPTDLKIHGWHRLLRFTVGGGCWYISDHLANQSNG